jgi:phosphoribosylglycinamide formyltransferase-1
VNRRLGVLISGRGSNLQAILDAINRGDLNASVALVISSRADAAGLERARAAGVKTAVLKPQDYRSRDAYDRAIAETLTAANVGLVCLAGFMRLVGPSLLDRFTNAIVNIHPSLLPAFPGLEAQRQALEHGVKVSGATVHLVTRGLDDGPIVGQSAVPVLDSDTVDTLSARILIEEHRLYPKAIQTLLDNEWTIEGRRVRMKTS